jgi:hypothetical protein
VRLADLLDAWLFAEADASIALGDWSCAADDDKSDAYAAYRAALDREEQAAVVLERFVAEFSNSCELQCAPAARVACS